MSEETKIPETEEAKEEKTEAAPEPEEKEPNGEGKRAKKEKAEKRPKKNEELEKLKKEAAEYKDQLLRTAAEYDNYRKRTRKELDDRYRDARIDSIQKLLPVIDNFARAVSAGEGSAEDLKKGMEMIYKQFLSLLDSMGVKEIGKVGETFDPSLHNAVMHVDDESLGGNVIAEVFQTGFMLDDRVVRHAMVKVAN